MRCSRNEWPARYPGPADGCALMVCSSSAGPLHMATSCAARFRLSPQKTKVESASKACPRAVPNPRQPRRTDLTIKSDPGITLRRRRLLAAWPYRQARSRTWPPPPFAISPRFIYKTLYAPTKIETDGTPAFILLSRNFQSAIPFQRSGGRSPTEPMLQEDSLIPSGSLIFAFTPSTAVGFDNL